MHYVAILIKVNFKSEFKVSIFVGNLPFRAEREDVLQLFLPFGEVTNCSLPLERDTGRKRGFAFVEMASETIESAAIDGLQGSEMMGRPLRINKAEPRSNTPRKNYGYGNSRNGNNNGYDSGGNSGYGSGGNSGYGSGGNSGYGSGGNSAGYSNRYGSNNNNSSYTEQNFNSSNRSSGAKGWEDRSYGNNNLENSEYESGRSRRRRGGTNNIDEQANDQQNN